MANIKLRYGEKILYYLIFLYPVLNMWFSIITNHSALRTFYFLYAGIVLLVYFRKAKIKKSFLPLLLWILTKLIYDYMSYPNSISDAIELALLLAFFYIYATGDISEKYILYLSTNARKVFIVYIIYLLGVALTVATGVGITTTWNTTSLQGPYGLAHYFAYELLILIANCYLLFMRENKGKRISWAILMSIFGALLIFTTVRTVLLCIVIAIAYVFLRKSGYKKFGVAIIGVIGILVIFRYTNLFNSVIEKTQYAISLGSATGARGLIWQSSWNYFLIGSNLEKLLGNGIDELMRWNHSYINMHIQAHNDFLTILAAFGILSLIVYVYYLIRFCKQKGGVGLLLALIALIIYNGLYSYSSLIIGLPSLKLVFETINNLYVEQDIKAVRSKRKDVAKVDVL